MHSSKLLTIEQAVYTSVRGKLTSGYQLAAASPGISPELARELSRWGPAHDCLEDPTPSSQSWNFHALDDFHWCLSQTIAAGAEYSGRRGPRIVTQMFVLDEVAFESFDYHPIRALQAIQASCSSNLSADLQPALPSQRMRAPTRFLPQVNCEQLRRLEAIRDAIGDQQAIAVCGRGAPRSVLKRLFDCLPPQDRKALWFTTGLRHSLRRPFRLYFLPAELRQQRVVLAQTGAVAFDLTFLEAPGVGVPLFAAILPSCGQ